jgi:hypothetical protein
VLRAGRDSQSTTSADNADKPVEYTKEALQKFYAKHFPGCTEYIKDVTLAAPEGFVIDLGRFINVKENKVWRAGTTFDPKSKLSTVHVAPVAFRRAKTLFYTLGHELSHAKHSYFLPGNYDRYPATWTLLTETAAYRWEMDAAAHNKHLDAYNDAAKEYKRNNHVSSSELQQFLKLNTKKNHLLNKYA